MRGLWALLVVVAAVVALAGAVIVVLSGSSTTAVVDLEIGECIALDVERDLELLDSGRLEAVSVVGCDEPHLAEVVDAGELNEDGDAEYPPDEMLFAEIDRRCGEAVRTIDRALLDEYGLLPIAPDEGTWSSLSGRYSCLAIAFGGEVRTDSIVDAG